MSEMIDNQKTIIFRADGDSSTGLGHLYRLFALVEMVKAKYSYVFLTSKNTILSVFPEDYKVKILPAEASDEREIKWIDEEYDPKTHLIIADGYKFDSKYQKGIKESGFTLFFIDDLATQEIYADVVINHSMYINEKEFNAQEYTEFALGSKFAILRPSFIKEAKKLKEANKINNVFVCFGGSDFHDLTAECIKGLLKIDELEKIYVILGGAYKHTKIFEIINKNEEKLICCKNLSENDMLSLLQQCQLAIIPASTISYEVASVKLSMLCGWYIDNQRNIHKGLLEKDLIFDAGDFVQLSAEDYEQQVREIIRMPKKIIQQKLDNQHQYFDGNQTDRFINLISKYAEC